ncbi:MAG: sulfurtransferase complex subunit TusB [Nitrospinae bacterium]|nr:sulfurtransferase complex subunit TusB [Nitrospinota bacterium]
MLHTINKSPFVHKNLESCLRFAKKGDPIMLYEDGVYTVAAGSKIEPMVAEALKKHPIYAIEADVKARGITKVIDGVYLCDYYCFVALVEQHKVYPWF